MKKIMMAAAVALTTMAAPAAAGPKDDARQDPQRAFEQSSQAAEQACHGQGRAWHAERLGGNTYNNGYFISRRGGAQHEINIAWVEYYCGDWPGAH